MERIREFVRVVRCSASFAEAREMFRARAAGDENVLGLKIGKFPAASGGGPRCMYAWTLALICVCGSVQSLT